MDFPVDLPLDVHPRPATRAYGAPSPAGTGAGTGGGGISLGVISLEEKDYRPIAGYPFQRWGERAGRPFADLRPLGPDAARRVWRRTVQISGGDWDGALPSDRFPRQDRLNLRDPATAWDEASVRDWLLAHCPDRNRPVLACYGPEWAVEVEWGAFCDHWLTFLWVDACAWPTSEAWFLRCYNELFVFGHRL